ncbi:MAG: hypothetical protein ACR2FV_14530 [Ornithinimicrobium sp.]|uniref:hypothetical protein n=1 Tax=Ornithinimicrobium sp. TaxID=1977084 RepID=UPI003D9B0B9F
MSHDGTPPPGGPGGGFDDIDRRFSEIVAHLQDPRQPATPESPDEPGSAPAETGETRPAPGEGDDPGPPEREPATPASGAGADPSVPAVPGVEGAGPWRGSADASRPDPADDHFVPPDPPPLPAGDLHFWAILVGLSLGPLLLLLSTVLPLLDGPVWGALGVVLSVTGFVLLVLRSPGRDGDDDWGAQV